MAFGCRRPPVDDQEFPVRYCLVAGCRCVTSCMLPQSACVGGVHHDGLHVFAGASSGGASMPGIPPRCYVLFYAIGLAVLCTQTAAYSPRRRAAAGSETTNGDLAGGFRRSTTRTVCLAPSLPCPITMPGRCRSRLRVPRQNRRPVRRRCSHRWPPCEVGSTSSMCPPISTPTGLA